MQTYGHTKPSASTLQELDHSLQSSLAVLHSVRHQRPPLPVLMASDCARSAFSDVNLTRAYQRQLDALLLRMVQQLETARLDLLHFQSRSRTQFRHPGSNP